MCVCVFSVGGADKRGAGTQSRVEDSGQDHCSAHIPATTAAAAAATGTTGELVLPASMPKESENRSALTV